MTGDGDGLIPPRNPGQFEAAAFPKRFYKAVTVEPVGAGFALLLDGRGARTPGRNPFVVPSAGLAEALAGEWTAVGSTIDPRKMPLTRIVNSVIDGVSLRQAAVMAEVKRFAASDLLTYRAVEPDELVRLQRDAWDPVIRWARDHLQAEFRLAEGVVSVDQPPQTLLHVARALDALVGDEDVAPYRVGALHVITTLTGSALLAAAVAAGHVSNAQAWSAAHVDEDYQISRWGEDAEAGERRASRWVDMSTACEILRLTSKAMSSGRSGCVSKGEKDDDKSNDDED